MKEDDLTEALLALCDMVGQHCRTIRKTCNGADVIAEPIFSSDDEAVGVLIKHGYMQKTKESCFEYEFTEKAGVWGPFFDGV